MLDLFDRLIGCHFVVIVDGVEVDDSFKLSGITISRNKVEER